MNGPPTDLPPVPGGPAEEGSRAKRQRRRPIEQWRPQVLDAARAIINRDGAPALSMEGIARELHLAKPRIYAAFPSLPELLHALRQRESLALKEAWTSILGDLDLSSSYEAIAESMIEAMADSVAAMPETYRFLVTPLDSTGPGPLAEQLTAFIELLAVNDPSIDAELGARSVGLLAEDAVRLMLEDPTTYTAGRFVDFARWIVRATTNTRSNPGHPPPGRPSGQDVDT